MPAAAALKERAERGAIGCNPFGGMPRGAHSGARSVAVLEQLLHACMHLVGELVGTRVTATARHATANRNANDGGGRAVATVESIGGDEGSRLLCPRRHWLDNRSHCIQEPTPRVTPRAT